MSDIVGICCRSEDVFCRAHRWAINRGLTSLLISVADLPALAALTRQLGTFSIIVEQDLSDRLSGLPVIAADSLPDLPLPAPQLWPKTVTLLFTSGSTGEPNLIPKSAAALLGELDCLRSALPPTIASAQFVATVPLEHMFGYIFAYWLPRILGTPAPSVRARLPQDLRAIGASAPAPLWLVTTPLHLRAYGMAGGAFPNVAGVLCATAPLDPQLAWRARDLFGVPVTEIYGSTETGAVACRRWDEPGGIPLWRPLAGVAIEADLHGNAVCTVSHLAQPVTMADRITISEAGFLMVGRDADLVKLAGKRQSISGLNVLLTSLPGVLDGVFFDPASTDTRCTEPIRLVAFAVLAPGWTAAHILSAMRERVDALFLPRPLFVVDQLPRLETGKLRHSDLLALHARCRALQAADRDSEVSH